MRSPELVDTVRIEEQVESAFDILETFELKRQGAEFVVSGHCDALGRTVAREGRVASSLVDDYLHDLSKYSVGEPMTPRCFGGSVGGGPYRVLKSTLAFAGGDGAGALEITLTQWCSGANGRLLKTRDDGGLLEQLHFVHFKLFDAIGIGACRVDVENLAAHTLPGAVPHP